MPDLLLVRHGQASFGAADYDVLSDTGWDQARALGRALARLGEAPASVWIGAQRRHRETLEGILDGLGQTASPQVHPGFNEFDFTGLLNARFAGRARPENLHSDRKTHFRALRETVLEWQRGQIADPPETYAGFSARVRAARQAAVAGATGPVLVVSSGGAIGQSVAEVMGAPADAMIRLQLQIRNCAVARIFVTPQAEHLVSFNEVPFLDAANMNHLLTYS